VVPGSQEVKACFAVILAEALPHCRIYYRITLAKTNGTLSMVIPEHTITCIPTLALQTTATETPSKDAFNLCHRKCQAVGWGIFGVC
jgi:hypothetical protein